MTDYEREVEGITRDIAELGENALRTPIDVDKATRYVYALYQRASLRGDFRALADTERAIDQLISLLQRPDDLYLLKANLAFKMHRLEEVKRSLNAAPGLAASEEGMKIRADVDFQQGRYAEAKRGYESALQHNRSWDSLARYAHFVARMEDMEKGDALFADAQEEVTSKQMRHYAWLELQRGLLDFAQARLTAAEMHCRRALQAYSGYWLAHQHLAAVLATQGRHDEAIALYADVLSQAPRPEVAQQLGDLHARAGRHDQAKSHYQRALGEYLESARRSEPRYYHHLVDYYCEVEGNGAAAIPWARRDLELRENFATQSALAWALFLDGQLEEAAQRMDDALRSGVIDAPLFARAAKVYKDVARPTDAQQCTHRIAYLAYGAEPLHAHGH